MAPLVSIILPNYNHQNFLEERIESILNQSFQNYEIIILDDASTDNSFIVLNKYKHHPKVSQFIVNDKNSGSPFIQWKKGIELAQGDYIWIAETDDVAEVQFLEKTVKVLNQNKNSGLVYTDSMVIDENNNQLGLWSVHKNSFFKTTRWSADYEALGITEIVDYLFYKVTINNMSAVLFRKISLQSIDLNQLIRYRNVGDLFTYTSVLLNQKISYISLPLNNYRNHSSNATKSNQKNGLLYLERISFFDKMIAVLILNSIDLKSKEKLIEVYKFILAKNGFAMIDHSYEKQLNSFVTNLSNHKILKINEARYYKILFRIYGLDFFKLKGFSKKIIKRKLKRQS